MNVNQVSFTGANQTKKPMTKGQKAAAITGAVVGTAAVASAVAAFAMGKKVNGNILAGYKAMGSFIADKAVKGWDWAGKKFGEAVAWANENVISKFKNTQAPVEEVVEEVVEVVEEVAEAL